MTTAGRQRSWWLCKWPCLFERRAFIISLSEARSPIPIPIPIPIALRAHVPPPDGGGGGGGVVSVVVVTDAPVVVWRRTRSNVSRSPK